MASRAHLLAGLRTGGPRSSSPFEGDRSTQVQTSPGSNSASPTANGRILKANAAPFTPGSRAKQSNGSDGQSAAARMQQAIAAATSQRPTSYSNGEDFAALYGAQQQQPNANEYQQQEMANLIRQSQAQMIQNQMLAQQQQQAQQLEMYRLQAASQQQQHLQQVAVQQRLLLAQMQAEYNQQQQEKTTFAQDQRMAAQATIQASLRQRQAEQMYAQLMEQQQQGQQGEEIQMQQQQQQQLIQRLQLLQLQAAAMQGMQDLSFSSDDGQQYNRRNGSPRADSPSNSQQQQQNRRDRQASQTAADNATSWRSTSVALPKGGRTSTGRTPPSIVVDDNASEKSEGGSGGSGSEDNETPETSEEDISTGMFAVAKGTSDRLIAEKRAPSTSPRPLPLNLNPRSRVFSSEGKTSSPANGSAGISAASRQPRGPPTEFLSINFTSRLSARTRREAMSKLCASPRAASFNVGPRPTVVA